MNAHIEALLSTYPRTRPTLPDEYRHISEREYKLNREGTQIMEGLAQRMEAWMHRRVAAQPGSPVLELGAGTLNHLPFESDLSVYDVVEPFTALYENNPRLAKLRDLYPSTDDIPADRSYARIISVAVLEHLENLPVELARCCNLMDGDGVFQAGIPSEGGFIWWLGWRCTTGISFWMRNRLDYGVMMRHEHLNTATEIMDIVRLLFERVWVRRFPLPFHSLSLYAYIEASGPRRDVAEEVLKRYDP